MPCRSYSGRMPRAVRLHAGEVRLEQRGHVRRLRETARHVLGHTPAHRAVRDATAVSTSAPARPGGGAFSRCVSASPVRRRQGGSPAATAGFLIEMTLHVLHRDAAVAPAPLQFVRGQRMIIE